MIVCIIYKRNSISATLTTILFLCIQIRHITSIDPVDFNVGISRTDSTDADSTTVSPSSTTATTTTTPITTTPSSSSSTSSLPSHSADERVPQSNNNIAPNSNSILTSTESLPIVEKDVIALSNDDKSDSNNINNIPSAAAPVVAENQTTNTSQNSATISPKKNLSSINSFEEWKQQQLHADLLKKGETTSHDNVISDTVQPGLTKGASASTNIQQVAPTIGLQKKGKLRKNFASSSCGAKVLAHNPEAQNVASILSSSPDEYMLNPCNVKIWFVIELCESIRILNIELANFELFSSVPKTFRVAASDRYPTKDWHRHQLGTFNVSYNRTIQSFQISASTTYVKYIKFELIDFHGHEHYCPLSVIRIHGSNVEDEIMIMEENTNLIDAKLATDIKYENENEDDDDDNDNNESNDQQVGGIIGSAILDLAKRVFRRQTIRGTTSTTSMTIIETHALKADCHQSVLNGSITNDNLKYSEAIKQCIAEFLHGLWSKFNTCTIYLSQTCFKLNHCCQCPVTINKNKTKEVTSTFNLYISPCGYYHVLTNQFVCKKEQFTELNKTKSENINIEANSNLEKNLTVDKIDHMIYSNESTNTTTDQLLVNTTNVSSNETETQLLSSHLNDQSSLTNKTNDTTISLESSLAVNSTNFNSSQTTASESIHTSSQINESPTDINHTDDISTITTTTSPPPPATAGSTSTQNEVFPQFISSPWLKGMLMNTKSLPELFKIIEKLNFNLTLSNRYLQELSQHYVKKLDETQQTTDLLLNASKAANEKFEHLEKYLYKLQSNFDDVSERLIKVEAWIPVIILTIFCMFIWSILVTCRLIRIKRKLKLILIEYESFKNLRKVENHENEEHDADDEDSSIGTHSLICNGFNKRKLSTDSTDSNSNRPQRVPESTLSKIKENGTVNKSLRLRKKSSPPQNTQHLLTLSTI